MQYSMIEGQSPRNFGDNATLKYDGSATAEHSIDAEFYARSLLGFGRALRKANKFLVNIDLKVNLKAETEGSWESLTEFLTCKDVQATAIIMQFLAFFGIDFTTIQKLPTYILKLATDVIRSGRGKKKEIRKIVKELNISLESKEKFIRLLENFDFRSAIDEMTAFLTLNGMDSIEIIRDGTVQIRINKSERKYFVAQPEDEISTETDEKLVSIIYISPEKNKWQFKSGAMEFWAEVRDYKFLESMKDKALDDISGLEFAASVEKITIKEANTKRIKVERKIFEFRPASKQALLPLA